MNLKTFLILAAAAVGVVIFFHLGKKSVAITGNLNNTVGLPPDSMN